MRSIKKDIEVFIQSALGFQEEVRLQVPTVKSFGHYSMNSAMLLAKENKKKPLSLAQAWAKELQAADKLGLFKKVEAVEPGFVNFWLSEEYLKKEFFSQAGKKDFLFPLQAKEPKKIILEYSSPNIAKPMHVGHGRNTIIGNALANIFEHLGHSVVRWNYYGDWGTQFGKLIAAYKLWGSKEKIKENPIKEMVELYVRFHREKDEKLEEFARDEFKKLTEGDKENLYLWRWFTKVSLEEFSKTYEKLGVRFDVFKGESAYEEAGRQIVKFLLDKKIAKKSEGAVVVNLEKQGLPTALLQKNDGVSLYLTRELGLLKDRLEKYSPDKILVVVGNEQTLHFQQLLAIAQKMKLLQKTELEHVKYGLVLNEEGKKFSTRKGDMVELEEVLVRLQSEAEKNLKKGEEASPAEKEKITKAVSLGAYKYNDLKENRVSDIRFNWKQMLDIHGDSGPYLQYTFARLSSILEKAREQKIKPAKSGGGFLDKEEEVGLIKKIFDFSDVLERCADARLTSPLAKYLYELAKEANQYYEKTRILSDANEKRRSERLFLVGAASLVLKKGMEILGVEALDRI